MVYVGLCQNLGPLFTAVLSFFILKLALSRLNIVVLMVSLVGVFLIITGSSKADAQVVMEGDSFLTTVVPYLTLVLFPVFDSIIFIASSLIKQVPSLAISFYYALSMLIVFSFVTMVNTGTFFSLFATFEAMDFILLLGTGFVSASIGFMF